MTEPNDGDAALGDGAPFSTSTLVEPRVKGGVAWGPAVRSASWRDDDDVDGVFFFQIDLRLEMDPAGDASGGGVKDDDAAGGGFVGVPAEGTELADDVDEFLEDRPRERRILDDLRL